MNQKLFLFLTILSSLLKVFSLIRGISFLHSDIFRTKSVQTFIEIMDCSSAPAETKTNENSIPSIPTVDYVTVPFNQTSSKVGFVDVGPREGPVVIALHGAPGGVQDFAELYGPLADRGIRFIVPEFPGI